MPCIRPRYSSFFPNSWTAIGKACFQNPAVWPLPVKRVIRALMRPAYAAVARPTGFAQRRNDSLRRSSLPEMEKSMKADAAAPAIGEYREEPLPP
jgi:hypothetical protein